MSPERLVVSGVVITAGPRDSVLTRLPATGSGRNRAPKQLLDFAWEAIEHGYKVQVRRAVAPVLGRTALGMGLVIGVCVILSLSTGPAAIWPVIGLLAALFFVVWSLLPVPYANRLKGRPISGADRASTELWRLAVTDVAAGARSEDDLPELHRLLVQVANAEDKVTRLARRSRYDLDQSQTEVARLELATLVGKARDALGQPQLEGPLTPYLANRWTENAGLTEAQPANPEDLR